MEENFRYHWRKVPKRIRSAGVALSYQSAGMALCTVQSAPSAHCNRWVKIENFDQERVFRFGPLRQWSPSRTFYPFWAPTAENYESVFLTGVGPNGAFDWRATKTCIRSFSGATIGQIIKILTRRDFGPLRQWSLKFPSAIYYQFWRPHSRKFRFRLFNQGATKWVKFPNFLPGESTLHRNLRQCSRKFPSWIFYSFWPPYGQKFRFGLLDQGATKWVKFPNFSQFSTVGRPKWVKNPGGRPLA